MTNIQTIINSIDRAMMESIRVFNNGSVGKDGSYIVVNHEGTDAYEVKVEDGVITECTCPHSHYRKACCKHMVKVSLINGLNIEQLNRVPAVS